MKSLEIVHETITTLFNYLPLGHPTVSLYITTLPSHLTSHILSYCNMLWNLTVLNSRPGSHCVDSHPVTTLHIAHYTAIHITYYTRQVSQQRVLHGFLYGCNIGIKGVFKQFLRGVKKVLQGCYSFITELLQLCVIIYKIVLCDIVYKKNLKLKTK